MIKTSLLPTSLCKGVFLKPQFQSDSVSFARDMSCDRTRTDSLGESKCVKNNMGVLSPSFRTKLWFDVMSYTFVSFIIIIVVQPDGIFDLTGKERRNCDLVMMVSFSHHQYVDHRGCLYLAPLPQKPVQVQGCSERL